MFIYGSLSGIQDYLPNVKEEGGGQASQMRARSFRIQVVAECVALRVGLALGASADDLLLCAAGKFALRSGLPGDEVRRRAAVEGRAIDGWLLRHTHGQLRLALAFAGGGAGEGDGGGEGGPAAQYSAAMRELQRAKLRAFVGTAAGDGGWDPSALCPADPLGHDAQAEEDKVLGK